MSELSVRAVPPDAAEALRGDGERERDERGKAALWETEVLWSPTIRAVPGPG